MIINGGLYYLGISSDLEQNLRKQATTECMELRSAGGLPASQGMLTCL